MGFNLPESSDEVSFILSISTDFPVIIPLRPMGLLPLVGDIKRLNLAHCALLSII